MVYFLQIPSCRGVLIPERHCVIYRKQTIHARRAVVPVSTKVFNMTGVTQKPCLEKYNKNKRIIVTKQRGTKTFVN